MPRSGMPVSPHTWGLLLGAPMLPEVGLAPTDKAQRALDSLAPYAKANLPITSRRTMALTIFSLGRLSIGSITLGAMQSYSLRLGARRRVAS